MKKGIMAIDIVIIVSIIVVLAILLIAVFGGDLFMTEEEYYAEEFVNIVTSEEFQETVEESQEAWNEVNEKEKEQINKFLQGLQPIHP